MTGVRGQRPKVERVNGAQPLAGSKGQGLSWNNFMKCWDSGTVYPTQFNEVEPSQLQLLLINCPLLGMNFKQDDEVAWLKEQEIRLYLNVNFVFIIEEDPRTLSDQGFKDVAFWKEAVQRFCTIRLLFALAAIHDLVIHQMDVKTAFLNGDLDEEIYMKQPEGFMMPGHENEWPIENPTDAVNYTGAVLDGSNVDLSHLCLGGVTEQSCLCAVFNRFMGKFECSSSSHAPDKMAKQKEKSSFDAATVSYKEAAAYCAGMVSNQPVQDQFRVPSLVTSDSPKLFESSSRFAKRKRTPIEDSRTSQLLPDIEPIATTTGGAPQ
ncbi:zinc finger, CCHC-type containing protein, partial [Tanacetum coccineum]